MDQAIDTAAVQAFLEQAWEIEGTINRRIEERNRLTGMLASAGIANYSGMPRGGNADWTRSADSAVDMLRDIGADIDRLCRLRTAINAAIDAVDHPRYREVLESRYRVKHTWAEIAEAMNLSDEKYVRKLHREALTCVGIPAEFAREFAQ